MRAWVLRVLVWVWVHVWVWVIVVNSVVQVANKYRVECHLPYHFEYMALGGLSESAFLNLCRDDAVAAD